MVATKLDVLFIVGPTASGKSDLAMKVAQNHNGEIICADSQTLRRDLNIGTAKPTEEDQKKIRHHLLDIIDPYDRFSVAEFKELTNKVILDIKKRGKLPIVVGGTGLYVDAVLFDFQFRGTSSEYSREELEALSTNDLKRIIKDNHWNMPENENNPRHLIRVVESHGQKSKKGQTLKNSVIVGIDPGKEILEQRITGRINKMIKAGFIKEVENVLKKYGEPPKNFDAIGYKIAYSNRTNEGVYDIDKIAEQFAIADRKYAKRQRSWLKRNKDITWFEDSESAYRWLNTLF